MARYHINFEGKVYPCKAKVLKCPYGQDFHSNSKVELYYKLMGSYGSDTESSEPAMKEVQANNRLKSLHSLSPTIEKVDYPVDVVVATLRESISHVKNSNTRERMNAEAKKWKGFESNLAILANSAYRLGIDPPTDIPHDIKILGLKQFRENHNSKVLYFSNKDELTREKHKNLRLVGEMYPEIVEYEKYKRSGLNDGNFDSTHGWMSKDFEKFSHDLNTSKMITQPIFYGDLEKAKKTIADMDNYELLSTLDDFSVTDKEIERNVKEANYFKYEKRNDLTFEANEKMDVWYNRNREIYESWRVNTPKRVLLSMEVAKELDRRTILRQDSNVGEMLSDEKEQLV